MKDNSIEALMATMGPPERVMPHNFLRWQVYAWVRDGRVMYVGKGNAASRPLSRSHHVLRNMNCGDEVWLYPQENEAKALEVEAALIRLMCPPWNGGGKPFRRLRYGPEPMNDSEAVLTLRVEAQAMRIKNHRQEANRLEKEWARLVVELGKLRRQRASLLRHFAKVAASRRATGLGSGEAGGERSPHKGQHVA